MINRINRYLQFMRSISQNLRDRARKLNRDIPALFLAMKDKETPVTAKLLAAAIVGYALSPIDLIPDFIPFLGYLDDIIILPCLIVLAIKLIPDNVMMRCREKAEGMWTDGKPVKWYYAVPVILVWLIVIWVIVHNLR